MDGTKPDWENRVFLAIHVFLVTLESTIVLVESLFNEGSTEKLKGANKPVNLFFCLFFQLFV